MPDDQLPTSTKFVNHGRTIAGVRTIQCSPNLFASQLIEANLWNAVNMSFLRDQLIKSVDTKPRRLRHGDYPL
jgi:hypothetical protein